VTDSEKSRQDAVALERMRAEGAARERKREMWMWFVGLMFTLVAVTIIVVASIDWFEHRGYEENITKRAKLQACTGIETETARVVCVNGWGN
jgi:hypothetical protein